MKKFIIASIVLFLTTFAMPQLSNAASNKSEKAITSVERENESVQANILLARLHALNSMDNSNLNTSEKKARRNEVRSIKKQLSTLGGGVYLSVGALIIIILLLIHFL